MKFDIRIQINWYPKEASNRLMPRYRVLLSGGDLVVEFEDEDLLERPIWKEMIHESESQFNCGPIKNYRSAVASIALGAILTRTIEKRTDGGITFVDLGVVDFVAAD